MRIVHTEASKGWGGQEIRILNEALGMIARGHQVSVLCPSDTPIYQEALKRGIPVVDLPIGRKKITGICAALKWIKNNPVDIINSHSSTDSWLIALASLVTQNPPQLVRTRHISAAIPKNWATRWLYCKATRHIVTTGETLRQQLIRDNRFPAEQITSVPTGIDIQRFQPGDKAVVRAQLNLPQDKLLIGIAATLRSWKGHRYLIEAFAGLVESKKMGTKESDLATIQTPSLTPTPTHEPAADEGRSCSFLLPRGEGARRANEGQHFNLGLVIIGEGPQREALEKLIADLNLKNHVWMVGNQTEVLPWLQALDIFALPSYANEGVPQALVQAMLCGLPCVTTPVGSITEAAIEGETALLVQPENVEDLRKGLLRLIEDETLREKLGKAARDHCQKQFSFERMLDRMERVFKEVKNGI